MPSIVKGRRYSALIIIVFTIVTIALILFWLMHPIWIDYSLASKYADKISAKTTNAISQLKIAYEKTRASTIIIPSDTINDISNAQCASSCTITLGDLLDSRAVKLDNKANKMTKDLGEAVNAYNDGIASAARALLILQKCNEYESQISMSFDNNDMSQTSNIATQAVQWLEEQDQKVSDKSSLHRAIIIIQAYFATTKDYIDTDESNTNRIERLNYERATSANQGLSSIREIINNAQESAQSLNSKINELYTYLDEYSTLFKSGNKYYMYRK